MFGLLGNILHKKYILDLFRQNVNRHKWISNLKTDFFFKRYHYKYYASITGQHLTQTIYPRLSLKSVHTYYTCIHTSITLNYVGEPIHTCTYKHTYIDHLKLR